MRLFVLLLTFLIISGCEAPPSPDCSGYKKDGDIHYWNGRIKEISYMCFEWSDFDTLVITSIGGSTNGAAQIITDIKAFQISTEVAEYCLSACVYIASHGIERRAHKGSYFGVHDASNGKRYLNLYNIRADKDWLAKVSPSYSEMYYFNPSIAVEKGVIDNT